LHRTTTARRTSQMRARRCPRARDAVPGQHRLGQLFVYYSSRLQQPRARDAVQGRASCATS
jgi:hypothetical protein